MTYTQDGGRGRGLEICHFFVDSVVLNNKSIFLCCRQRWWVVKVVIFCGRNKQVTLFFINESSHNIKSSPMKILNQDAKAAKKYATGQSKAVVSHDANMTLKKLNFKFCKLFLCRRVYCLNLIFPIFLRQKLILNKRLTRLQPFFLTCSKFRMQVTLELEIWGLTDL